MWVWISAEIDEKSTENLSVVGNVTETGDDADRSIYHQGASSRSKAFMLIARVLLKNSGEKETKH